MSALAQRLSGWCAGLADRVNPVLVKEVRQALRGNFFRGIFWLTLSGALVVGLMVLVTGSGRDDASGGAFFEAIFACMAAATHGFVPFAAYTAMGSEWEENTYDLLMLSNLKPRQIVVGKLLASGVQALLLYSAFAPFLVFAFLLGGVDLVAILIVLAGSMLLSLCLSASALATSSSTHGKFARMAVMAGLAAVLGWATVASYWLGVSFVNEWGGFGGSGSWVVVAPLFSLALFYVPLPVAQSCARLAHPEENRSTFLRVHAHLLLAFALGWALYGLSRDPSWEVSLAISMAAIVLLSAAALAFVPEPRLLGRRARLGIPRSRALALLSFPWQPGGTRVLPWYLVGACAIWAWYVCVNSIWPDPHESLEPSALLAPFVAALYGWIYIGLPTLMVREREERSGVRLGIRLMGVAVAGLGFLLPSMVGFFAGSRESDIFDHVGNPVWMVGEVVDGSFADFMPSLVGLVIAAILVLALNLRRTDAALSETLRASAANRARARGALRVPTGAEEPLAGGS